MVIGSIGLRAQDVFFVANLVYFLLLLFCGVNVPLDELPGWMQAIGRCLPLTHGIDRGARGRGGRVARRRRGARLDRARDRRRLRGRGVHAVPLPRARSRRDASLEDVRSRAKWWHGAARAPRRSSGSGGLRDETERERREREALETDLEGSPLRGSCSAGGLRNFRPSLESYVASLGGPLAYMQRQREIELLTAAHERDLAAAWREAAEASARRCGRVRASWRRPPSGGTSRP